MNFTVNSRKNLYKIFYEVSELKYKKKDEKNQYVYVDLFNSFENKQEIASGIEGKIYKVNLYNDIFLGIKLVDLKKMITTKNINKEILDKTPKQIYDLFYSLSKNTSYPSLIEIISFTLTNQLVFQKICPHFVLNYYWEYKNNQFIHYNEFINYDTLQNWAKESRAEHEWVNILLQVLFAIISMKKYFNMTHCDVYTKNILVQKVSKGGAWKYIINNKEYLLPNIGWVVLINDFGFTTIPDKMYVEWYYKRDIEKKPPKEYELFDFNKLAYDLLSSHVFDNFEFSKNILTNSLKLFYNNNIEILNATYDLHIWYFKHIHNKEINTLNNDIIEIYNMDKHLNKKLLPPHFDNFSTF